MPEYSSEYSIVDTQLNGKTVYHIKYRDQLIVKNIETHKEAEAMVKDHKILTAKAKNWSK